jgi:hypothetical protein
VITARAAFADPPAAESLARGIRAFETRQYKLAAKLFQSALARGSLTRAQTLTAYIDLGATFVALGKTDAGERAFEQAALIDPKFVVPPHSGRQATALANQARRKQDGVGPYHLEVGAPGEVKPGEAFKITVELTQEQADLVSLVRVVAQSSTGKPFDTVEPSATRVSIEIPSDAVVFGETVQLRFELLDNHDNRLATVEKAVSVTGKVAEPKPAKDPVKQAPKEPAKQPAKQSPPEDYDEEDGSAPPASKPPEDKQPTGKPGRNEDDGESGEGDGGGAAETGPWSIPHGSKKYTAVRTRHAPVIDGVLDDPIWQTAPKEDRFLSTKSKPYGKPTTEPTVVQLAYDERNLYVAFRCKYSTAREASDAYAGDEQTLLSESEYVAVIIDALHGHSGAYEFAVSPAGVRADAEIAAQGAEQNLDWHGIWNVDTAFTNDGWTAEFMIPWGTMYMPSSEDPFDIGIELERHDPSSGEESMWTLQPPATELYDVNFFGHADGFERVHPGQRLLLLPYAAVAFDSNAPAMQSQLTDLSGTSSSGRIYAGAYLRLRPPGPFRLDGTINPDFSAVSPDHALANYDRFELEYPEARPFFAEDAPRFQFGGTRYQFGDLGAQLFYSRRLGISTDPSGFTQIVPILWGVKSVFHDGGTEAAVMNVETIKPQSGIVLADNATVGRITETIDGQRVGAIALACGACGLDAMGQPVSYAAGGADAQLALYDRHLQLSGFFAGASTGTASGGAGEGAAAWRSQDVYAKASLLEVGKDFQAPLGFFETTGVHAETVAAGYTPVVRSDHVQQVFVDTQLSIVRDSDSDALLYRRAVVSGTLETIDGAYIHAGVGPSTETVLTPFPIGNGRVIVPAGSYKVLGTAFDLTSPPDRAFVFGLHYIGGDLFDGTRRAPGGMVGVNLGRLAARLSYTLYELKFEDQMPAVSFYGHDAAFTASYAYTPLARTTVVVEADTVAARASALAATTIQFGTLSAVTLSVRGTSGSTFDKPAMHTFDNKNVTAILSLQLGASPL